MSSAPSLTEAIGQMFNAIVTALTATISAIASWITQNADLIAALVMLGIIVGLVFRYGRRIFEAIRGMLGFI